MESLVPRRSVEALVRLGLAAQAAECHAEVERRLRVGRPRVLGRDPLQGGPQMPLCLRKPELLVEMNAELGVGAGVAGVAPHGFLVVPDRIDAGIVDLLDAQTRQVQFLDLLDVLRCGRRFDRLRKFLERRLFHRLVRDQFLALGRGQRGIQSPWSACPRARALRGETADRDRSRSSRPTARLTWLGA